MTATEMEATSSFGLAAPLDWRQFRTLLWEALGRFPRSDSGGRAWDELARYVNGRCAGSEPQGADRYEAVTERLEAAYPELATTSEGDRGGARVWSTVLYEAIHELFSPSPVFMNLGFLPEPHEANRLELAPDDEMYRPFVELYHRAVASVPLEGRDLLEIGCGCGGGASFLMRYHAPRSLVGIDLLERNVAAAALHSAAGLRFEVGDAQALRFADASFDAVVNVESSHSYPDFERFRHEVERVLEPGGHFFFVDHRPRTREWGEGRSMPDLEASLARGCLEVLESEDLTPGVVRASEAMQEPKQMMLDALGVDGHDRAHLEEVLHCRGSRNHARLASGDWQYRRWLLRKAGTGA